MVGCLAPVVLFFVSSYLIVGGLVLFDVPVQGLNRPVESQKPPTPVAGPDGRLSSMRFAQDAKPVNPADAEKKWIPFLHAESINVIFVVVCSLPILLLFFAVNAIVSPRFGKPAQDSGYNLLGLVTGISVALLVAVAILEITTGMWPSGGRPFREMATTVFLPPVAVVFLFVSDRITRMSLIEASDEGASLIPSNRRRRSRGRDNSTTPE